MGVATTDYLAAIAHLPAGAVLRIDDVSWEEYETLLGDLDDDYAVRIFYDQGRMEIMAPASAHEKPKSVLHTLVAALRDELDIDIESLGSTTFKAQMKATGAEPDDCFYIQNAALVIGKADVDIEHDPPPDLVIEIDRTSTSLDKFSIYAALGVPEIWRVVANRVEIYLLENGLYMELPASGAFAFLTALALSGFLMKGLTDGERKAAAAFRAWLRDHQTAS
jgi:Uma2 family endonuclease